MKPATQTLGNFAVILLFVFGAILIVGIAYLVNTIFSQSKPNLTKLSSYESGEEAIGKVWGHFNVQFYVIALIFLLFEAELLLLFPWAVVFVEEDFQKATNNLWQWFTFVEIFIFVAILVIGFVYLWKKGFLDWQKPNINTKDIPSVVPKDWYENL
jgi:NADH-quinone oxidoreductase subunit A